MEQLRAQLQDLELSVTEQTAAHRSDLACRDELMSQYMSDIRTLEHKLKHSEQQVCALC